MHKPSLTKAGVIIAEFGIHLAEFTIDPQSNLAVRQLASVLLKQYVESHWSEGSEKFRKPETSDAVCEKLKIVHFLNLYSSTSVI